MTYKYTRTVHFVAGAITGLLVVVWLLFFITSAHCEECLEADQDLLFDTSGNCANQVSNDRVFGSQVFYWHGTPYLVSDIGNDLRVWNIENDARPVVVGNSEFGWYVGNVGDSDYDMYNFSLCDDCRYGVANYKRGTVLFDMGTGVVPRFSLPTIYRDATDVPGAFTFKHGGQQYLIADGLDDECVLGSTLYAFDGVEDITRVDCVQTGGSATQIVGGYHVGDYLYLGNKSKRVDIFEITDGSPISLSYISTPWISYMIRDKGLSIDTDAHIAIEAGTQGMTVWDICEPGAPVEVSTVPGDWNRSAVKWPIVWVARKGIVNSEHTFDISDTSAPVEMDQGFWNPANAWNWPGHECSEIRAGLIYDNSLYLDRYSRKQRIDLTGCWLPESPNPAIFIDGFETGTLGAWSSSKN